VSYIVEGVDVAFARRDITQATDAEIEAIKVLIKAEKHMAGDDRIVTDMLIESDFVDSRCRYRLSTLVTAYGDTDPAEFAPGT
jgi:hypothetical protein